MISSIIASPNNLVNFEDLDRPKKFLCGLTAAIVCARYLQPPKKNPAEGHLDKPKIKCLENLIKFE